MMFELYKNSRLGNIIEELISTEEKYIKDLSMVVDVSIDNFLKFYF